MSAGILCYPPRLRIWLPFEYECGCLSATQNLPFQGWHIPKTTTPDWAKKKKKKNPTTSKTTWWRITPSHERLSHRWSACCCRTTPRSWRASSRTPTWTGSTGHPPWPTPGSARPRHLGTGRETRTPVPPTSGASTPTPGPPLCRSRMKPSLKYFTHENKN